MSGDLCVAIWLCRFPGCAKHASGTGHSLGQGVCWFRAVSRSLPSHRGPAEVVSPFLRGGEKHENFSCLGYRYTKQMRTVQTIRYVLPLREGGSLPAIVEADDLGLYVVKFRGAGKVRWRWSRNWSPVRSAARWG